LLRGANGQPAPIDFALRYEDLETHVGIANPESLLFFDTFVIIARVAVPWEIRLPLMPVQRLVLESRHVTFKEKPYIWYTPTPTTSPTPTLTPTSTPMP
jgi:hypothetical protein